MLAALWKASFIHVLLPSAAAKPAILDSSALNSAAQKLRVRVRKGGADR